MEVVKNKLWILKGLIVVATLIGCGDSAPEIVPVTGVVKLNGKPMNQLHIKFIPETDQEGRPASSATTDAEGRFNLLLSQEINGEKIGAVKGKHTIVLQDRNRPVVPPIPPPKVSPKYSHIHKTPLKIDLDKGMDLIFSVNNQGEVTIKTKG